jgi:hypothetical protein
MAGVKTTKIYLKNEAKNNDVSKDATQGGLPQPRITASKWSWNWVRSPLDLAGFRPASDQSTPKKAAAFIAGLRLAGRLAGSSAPKTHGRGENDENLSQKRGQKQRRVQRRYPRRRRSGEAVGFDLVRQKRGQPWGPRDSTWGRAAAYSTWQG